MAPYVYSLSLPQSDHIKRLTLYLPKYNKVMLSVKCQDYLIISTNWLKDQKIEYKHNFSNKKKNNVISDHIKCIRLYTAYVIGIIEKEKENEKEKEKEKVK